MCRSVPAVRGAARVVGEALARAAAAAARAAAAAARAAAAAAAAAAADAAAARENEQSAAQSPCGRMARGNRRRQRLEQH
jgi:hypothetical protein